MIECQFRVHLVSDNHNLIDFLFQKITSLNRLRHPNIMYDIGMKNFEIKLTLFNKYRIEDTIWDFDFDVETIFDKLQFFGEDSEIIFIFDYNEPISRQQDLTENIVNDLKITLKNYSPFLMFLGDKNKLGENDKLIGEKILKFKTKLETNFDTYIPFLINFQNHFNASTIIRVINFLSILTSTYSIKIKNNKQFRDYYYLMNLDVEEDQDMKLLTEAIENITSNKMNTLDPTAELHNLIENSNDEILENLAILKLFNRNNDMEYIQNLENNQNLSESARNLINIILRNDEEAIERRIAYIVEDDLVNEYLVNLIQDPILLEKICLEHRNLKIKIIAFNKFIPLVDNIPENIIFMVMKEFPTNLAIKAIQTLNDNNILENIIVGGYNKDIIVAALRKFEGPLSLRIKKGISEHKNKEVKGALIAKISDIQELMQIINGNYEHSLQVVAFRHLENYTSELLKEVIVDSPNTDLKELAIEMLDNQNLLYKLLEDKQIDSTTKILILKNLKKPTQEFFLKFLSENYGDRYISKAIYPHLVIDDDFSKDDLLTICSKEVDPNNLPLLIKHITSIKHLLLLRVTLDSSMQAKITERINNLENNNTNS